MSTELEVRAPAQMTTALNEEAVRLIKDQLMRGASDSELALYVKTCERVRLDPFAKQIYAIKRREKVKSYGREEWIEKWTVQFSIDGFRVIAERTGKYEGQVGPLWCGRDGQWRDVWLEDVPPAAAKVGVWKTGAREPTWGVALMKDFNQGGGLWSKMPTIMLAKCAEAQALRRAFPNDLSGCYTTDEMDQAMEPEEHFEPPTVPTPKLTWGDREDPKLPPAKPLGLESAAAERERKDGQPDKMGWDPRTPQRPPVQQHPAVQAAKAAFPEAKVREVDFPLDNSPAPGVSFEDVRVLVNQVPHFKGDSELAKNERKAWYADQMGVHKPARNWNPFHTWPKLTAAQQEAIYSKAKALADEANKMPPWATDENGDRIPGSEG
jgi:phage recombination protein Bet